MSKKAIEAVTEAELRAEAIRTEANGKAKQMTDKADERGRQLLEKTQNQSEALYRGKTETVKAQVAEIIENQTAAAHEDAEKLVAETERKMPEAKRLIIRRIEEKCQ